MKRIVLVLVLSIIILTGCHRQESPIIEETTEEEISVEETKTILPLSELPMYNYRTQEFYLYDHGQMIYGVAYIPETGYPNPAVIFSHGLGGNYQDPTAYAKALAYRGIVAISFDFRGGGGWQSDGETTDMSVMTEVSDLKVVLENARTWDFIDPDKIVLFGASQGGLVSAITAADEPEQVAGLILTYPAFSIGDVIHGLISSVDDMPESYDFGLITLGRPYVTDYWDYEVYDEIGKYDKKVLLLHGDSDPLVAVEYSDRAAEVYEDVEYFIIEGAEHGFYGDDFELSLEYVFNYLQQIDII